MPQLTPSKSLAVTFALVALAYFITAKLGHMLPYKESVVTMIWLPTGIAVGAIMRWGNVSLPIIYIAALLVEMSIGLPFITSATIACTNTLAPFFAAHLLKKFHFNYQLIREVDIVLMVGIALLGMSISASGGVLALYFSGLAAPENFAEIWLTWWVGDSVGVLLVLPLVLNVGKQRLQVYVQQYYQLFAWVIIFVICELVILSLISSENRQFMLSILLILPIFIWASMYFGIVGGSFVVIGVAGVVVWFTASGHGAFYSTDISEDIFSLWIFMVTLVVTMLLISASQLKRNLAERVLHEQDKKLKAIIDGALDAIVTINNAGECVEFNPAAEQIFGYKKEQVLGELLSKMIIPPQLRKFHDDGYRQYAFTGEKPIFNQRIEITAMRADSSEFPVELTLIALEEGGLSLVTGFIRDISEQKKARQEIERFAYYDVLTGLPNRRLLADRFQRAALISQRARSYCALVFIDLDNFKLLNDAKGHDVGDLLLIEVANRIKNVIRACDTVARLGGDEFVVIVENLDTHQNVAYQQVSEITQKILAELSKSYYLGLFEFNTSASLGVTLFHDNQLDFEEHLKHADIAMYQSKVAGRNICRFYDKSVQERIEKALSMESALSIALNNQEFHLNYQSIVDVDENVVAAEVLLRWTHPVMGNISPAEFIPIAERDNQIIKIGHWVLQQTCQQIQAWESHPQLNKIRLLVNVSAKQFSYIHFIQELGEILETTGIDPALLKLELTETAVVDNIEDVINKMKELRQMGIGVSLDDFGTGHSSLVYLKKLPVAQIKIDQSFVHDALTDASGAAIIQMVVTMGKAIQCDIVAEGVEQLEQFELLKSFGCRYFQGTYFSKPVAASGFERLVANA